jgi:photosystem II stability/assembly factor-like uncharacterized protein
MRCIYTLNAASALLPELGLAFAFARSVHRVGMTWYRERSTGMPLRVLALVSLGLTSHALAHDPPEVSRIAWSADATSTVFQTERGFIVGDTETRSYSWACVEGLDIKLGEHPGFVLLPDGVWMVATEHGLLTSSDQGCTWRADEHFGSEVASAVELAPNDSGHVYVSLAGAADGGLFESRDAGASWQKRLHLAPDDYVAQIKIAASDPARIYLNGLVIDEQTDRFSFQLTRSSDGGATWERTFVPLGPQEDHAVLAALSPVDPDALVVLARNYRWGEAPDRVLFSADAGATYTELSQGLKLIAAAFSPDGRAIMVAGAEHLTRIELAADSGAPASSMLVGMSQMLSCAQLGPAGLYACGHVNIYDPVRYGASISRDEGVTWESLMSFTEVKQRVACTDETNAQRCNDQWIDWQLEILVGLGGAPIDSVEGWMEFRGIEEVPHPAPAHTLSTARRTSAAGAAADGDAGAASSSKPEPAAASPNTTMRTEPSGCQSSPTHAATGYAWGVLALLSMVVRRRLRARGPVSS